MRLNNVKFVKMSNIIKYFIILDDKLEVSAIFGVCQDRLLRHRDREEWVASEALVDEHAEDAHHRRAAVVALRVELPLLAALARLVLVADLRC